MNRSREKKNVHILKIPEIPYDYGNISYECHVFESVDDPILGYISKIDENRFSVSQG